MRIVSGIYKGRLINIPKNFKLRPTTDIAKEGLFNILSNRYDFEDLEVLDLFSGTGSISYEFISRGCKSLVSIEKSFRHSEFIKNTFRELDVNNAVAIKSDVFNYINSCKKKFDLIFADPPFELENIDDIPNQIFSNNLLSENGILIVEHSPNTNFSINDNFVEQRKYGKVNFSFFEYQ
jgi:16S rRNA (guanine966-N2)-methyltransferase